MKFAKGLLMLGMVGLFAACEREDTDEPMLVQFAIICSTELIDAAGVVVASIDDTVSITAPRDTVGADPRPCRSTYNKGTRMLTLNAKSAADTATGDPRD